MKIDFNKVVYLQIGGEIGKNNSLQLDYFADLAKQFQKLVYKIVENDLSTNEALDMTNFKIELVDFKTGSAVPGFRFTQNTNMIIGADPVKQREQVSEKFESLLKLADTGNYLELKNLYPDYKRRNEIVNSLFGFVDSLKTPQAAFVDFQSSEITPLYKLRKFKKSTRDTLLVDVIQEKKEFEEIKYGKVRITTSNGKERKTIKEIYNAEATTISHVFEYIKTGEKIYQLTTPLMCTLEKEKDSFTIESSMVGVVGSGTTRQEAIEDFCQEFDYLYNKLRKLKRDQLSPKMKNNKIFFTVLIESIV
ncbi:MAG: hypothetical protein AAF990_01470 [Bacteroidota bacterium]